MSTVDNVFENAQKRAAILSKSLEKKRKQIQVLESVASEAPTEDIESNRTYMYYRSELERLEEAFEAKKRELDALDKRDKEIMERKKLEMVQKLEHEYEMRKQKYQSQVLAAYTETEKKTKYYTEAIELLKEKLATSKPTSKPYMRLKAEVALEEKEYATLLKDVEEGRKRYEELCKEQEKRRELQQVEKAREAARIRQEAERAEEDRRARERAEEAKKLYAAADTNSIISPAPKPSKISKTPPPPPEAAKLGGYLQRIRDATSIQDLDDIYKEGRGKFTDEEDALWDERFAELETKESEEPQEAAPEVAPEAPKESEAFKLLMEMPRAVINSQKGTDLFNTLESPLEMKKVLERMHALNSGAQPKAAALAPPQPVLENPNATQFPILKTTKFVVKQGGAPPRPVRPY